MYARKYFKKVIDTIDDIERHLTTPNDPTVVGLLFDGTMRVMHNISLAKLIDYVSAIRSDRIREELVLSQSATNLLPPFG